MQQSIRYLLLLLFASYVIPSCAATLRVVAYEGGSAPNVPGGVFRSLSQPSLNNLGQVAFSAGLVGRGSSHWSEGTGTLRMVAETGQPAPGLPGENFHRLISLPLLNDSGKISFAAEFATNSQAIWIERNGGTLEKIAALDEIAVGTGGKKFTYPFAPEMNSAGSVQFYSQLESTLSGIWSDSSGTLTALAVEQQQPPGTPVGAKYESMGTNLFNEAGLNTFSAYMQVGVGGVTSDDSVGIWSDRDGPLSLVLRSGSQAPGTPPGAILRRFDHLQTNAAGRIAFRGTLKTGSGGVTASNSTGIWSEGNGELALVARRGSQAPNTSLGASFFSFQSLDFSDAGNVAFIASLTTGTGGVTGVNDTGLWTGSGSTLSLVAREGDLVPGLSGAQFADFSGPSTRFSFNASGRIAFAGSMMPGIAGVTLDNNFGLWVQDAAGVLQLIAREGDQWQLAAGDFRTIAELTFGGQDYSAPFGNGFNNEHLAFKVTFTDGTDAVVVASFAAVPEPGSWILMATSLLSCAARCRRVIA